MVQCSCGKTLDKVPTWLAGVQVEFICNNCPNRQVKNIALVNLNPTPDVKPAEAEGAEAAVAIDEADDEASDDE